MSVHVYTLPLMLEISCSPADETLSDGSDWSLDESSTDDVPAGILAHACVPYGMMHTQ